MRGQVAVSISDSRDKGRSSSWDSERAVCRRLPDRSQSLPQWDSGNSKLCNLVKKKRGDHDPTCLPSHTLMSCWWFPLAEPHRKLESSHCWNQPVGKSGLEEGGKWIRRSKEERASTWLHASHQRELNKYLSGDKTQGCGRRLFNYY